MPRPLLYPFDELKTAGQSITIPARNYLQRNSIGQAARAYARNHDFTVSVSIIDRSCVKVTRK